MKLIDKDALMAEIKRLRDANLSNLNDDQRNMYLNTLLMVETSLKSLEVKEVNLKKELEKEWGKFLENGDIGYKEVAEHFFELGLKASSNISIEVKNIDKELKENGIDPNSKEAKIIKESYYIAIEKLSAQKG